MADLYGSAMKSSIFNRLSGQVILSMGWNELSDVWSIGLVASDSTSMSVSFHGKPPEMMSQSDVALDSASFRL